MSIFSHDIKERKKVKITKLQTFHIYSRNNLISFWTCYCCCYCCGTEQVVSYSFMTPWTVACQAPLSMGLPRQEYWSGWPCPHPDTGIKPTHRLSILIKPRSPALQADSLPSKPPGKHFNIRLRP